MKVCYASNSAEISHFMEKFLTVKEFAKVLRVTERTVFNYLKSGQLKAKKVGKWRIKESELKRFI